MTMHKLTVLFLAALTVAAVPLALQEGPAAVIVKVEGSVEIRSGGGDAVAAAVGTRLSVGDQLIPASGSRAVVVSRTGATRVVTDPVTLEAPSDDGEGDMFSRTVQVLAQAANTDARSQPNRQGMIRPIPGQPTQVAPRLGLAVADLRPTFTWNTVDGAEEYMVQIRRQGSAPMRFSAGRDTVWSFPREAPSLVPGETYMWTVAPEGGRPGRETSFQVAAPETMNRVAEGLQGMARSDLDPAGDGLFLSAILYREAGLYYEAAGVLDYLAKQEGTTMSREAWFLYGEVLDAVGRVDEAQRAFDRGDELGG